MGGGERKKGNIPSLPWSFEQGRELWSEKYETHPTKFVQDFLDDKINNCGILDDQEARFDHFPV